MKTYLFNPFKFIAGYKALIVGIFAMLITSTVCMFEKMHLDGVIDVHGPKETATYIYYIEPLVDWLCFVIPLYIFGRILSVSSIRFIDVAGTGVLARYPILFIVLINMFFPRQLNDPKKLIDIIQTEPLLVIRIIVLEFLIIPFIVWTVALMYNAYSISANLKGPKATWSFVAAIIFAEVVSKVIIWAIV